MKNKNNTPGFTAEIQNANIFIINTKHVEFFKKNNTNHILLQRRMNPFWSPGGGCLAIDMWTGNILMGTYNENGYCCYAGHCYGCEHETILCGNTNKSYQMESFFDLPNFY
jgi:hypothetical protein